MSIIFGYVQYIYGSVFKTAFYVLKEETSREKSFFEENVLFLTFSDFHQNLFGFLAGLSKLNSTCPEERFKEVVN